MKLKTAEEKKIHEQARELQKRDHRLGFKTALERARKSRRLFNQSND
ncbi:hypothetical protein AAFX24_27590 [Vibrio mediterranei]